MRLIATIRHHDHGSTVARDLRLIVVRSGTDWGSQILDFPFAAGRLRGSVDVARSMPSRSVGPEIKTPVGAGAGKDLGLGRIHRDRRASCRARVCRYV